MVDIRSRNATPGREDQQARRLIEEDRATITRLADRIINGGRSAARRAKMAHKTPQRSGPIISDMGPDGG